MDRPARRRNQHASPNRASGRDAAGRSSGGMFTKVVRGRKPAASGRRPAGNRHANSRHSRPLAHQLALIATLLHTFFNCIIRHQKNDCTFLSLL